MNKLKDILIMAHTAAECGCWMACQVYLKAALGQANAIKEQRVRYHILRALSFARRVRTQ